MRILNRPYWNLFWEMTRTGFKLRDQGTFLGFFWTLLHPAIMFVILHQLFTKWVGKFVSDYPFYLLIGIVQWNFFSGATSNALTCFERKATLVKNFNFPKEIAVLSSVAVVFMSYILEVAILMLFLLVMTHDLSWSWAYFPFLIAAQTLWILGLSFFLAVLGAEYRDMSRIWTILMNAGFFMVPIFYPLNLIAERKRSWLLLNPFVHIMDGSRDCLLRAKWPPLSSGLFLILTGLVLTWYGIRWFRAREKSIVEFVL